MTIRKIQFTGGSSFTVTLPKAWIDRNGIQKNDEIDVVEMGAHYLLLRPSGKKPLRQATIQVEKLRPVQIESEILGAYVAGVDVIRVVSRMFTVEQRSWIRRLLTKMVGFEMAVSGDEVVLTNVSVQVLHIRDYVERMLSMVQSMHSDEGTLLEKPDPILAKDVIDRDEDVDRHLLLIQRMYHQRLRDHGLVGGKYVPLEESFYYLLVAYRLEQIADKYVGIAEAILSRGEAKKIGFSEKDRRLMRRTDNLMRNLTRAILHQDRIAAYEILGHEPPQPVSAAGSRDSGEQIVSENLVRIANYITNIAEEAIHFLNISV